MEEYRIEVLPTARDWSGNQLGTTESSVFTVEDAPVMPIPNPLLIDDPTPDYGTQFTLSWSAVTPPPELSLVGYRVTETYGTTESGRTVTDIIQRRSDSSHQHHKNISGLTTTKRLDIAWAVIGAARFLVL